MTSASASQGHWRHLRSLPGPARYFSAMAQLPYTDGSNGNGIRDFEVLLRYFKRCPLAFYDKAFIASYSFLLKPEQEREPRVLAVFDNEGSSAETLQFVKETLQRGSPPAQVVNKLVRFDLRAVFQMHRISPLLGEDREVVAKLFILRHDAAAASLPYVLCVGCTAAESAGHAPQPLCEEPAAQLVDAAEGWRGGAANTLSVSCAVAQCLRGRKPEESERMQRKLDGLLEALRATPEQRRRLRASGRACDALACARREPYTEAFKACSLCHVAHYCSRVCKVRAQALACWSAVRKADAPFAATTEGALGASQGLLRARLDGAAVSNSAAVRL